MINQPSCQHQQPPVTTLTKKTASAASVADSVSVIASRDLLSGAACVFIEHFGALYSLRATRNGKLILTK